MDLLTNMEPHWFWLTVGVLMAAVEIVAPGFFMMWLGAAAILTGVTAWVLPISVPAQVGLFAILSVIAVYAARKWLVDNPIESEDPKLNDRGARLVGDIVTVVEAIEDGHGRVKVGDSVWSAKGRDVAIGTKVRVTGADGAVLLVEPA
jgi:hypothetical protein